MSFKVGHKLTYFKFSEVRCPNFRMITHTITLPFFSVFLGTMIKVWIIWLRWIDASAGMKEHSVDRHYFPILDHLGLPFDELAEIDCLGQVL